MLRKLPFSGHYSNDLSFEFRNLQCNYGAGMDVSYPGIHSNVLLASYVSLANSEVEGCSWDVPFPAFALVRRSWPDSDGDILRSTVTGPCTLPLAKIDQSFRRVQGFSLLQCF